MTSTELVSRILLTVAIVGAFSVNSAVTSSTGTSTTDSSSNKQSHPAKPKTGSVNTDVHHSSLDSPLVVLSSSPSTVSTSPPSQKLYQGSSSVQAETRLLPDSEESGILLPFDESDFLPPGDRPRLFPDEVGAMPSTIEFPSKAVGLRIANGKALESPKQSYYGLDAGKAFKDDLMKDASTYYLRNNCFGPRCVQQLNDAYFGKDKGKRYVGNGASINDTGANPSGRFDNGAMESMSANFHSQLAIPFVVVDDNVMKESSQATFSRKSGILDTFSRMTTTPSSSATEGWVRLKAITPDVYDPFRFSKNGKKEHGEEYEKSTFSKRNSPVTSMLTKRVGVELNPQSFADRWGWSANNDHDKRGGSRLPTWLEEKLKYGNRNSNQDKNWVKLEPIPVAGVSISKWVPKGTPVSELPTTSWQTDRDRPNGGSPWWDRVDDNRISSGHLPPYLRPSGGGGGGGNDDGGRYNGNGGHGGWGSGAGSKGSSLSSFDRYPTNSWNDVIYPEGPQSATVSWQQGEGMTNRPSSFAVSGGGSGGWSSGSDGRKPIVATGSWSAPPNTNNNRFPSFINRFNDHRSSSSSSYPSNQAIEEDPRWVLISNTRRVTSGSPPSFHRQADRDILDRSKILSYINRLHPDLNKRADFPFYESSHRHGKDIWPFLGGLSTSSVVVSPSRDEAFQRLNATLSTLTPVIVHRRGTPVTSEFGHTSPPSRFESSVFAGDDTGQGDSNNLSSAIVVSSTARPPLPPFLSTYLGDGRATINTPALLQSSTSTPLRNSIPGRIRQGFKNINPVFAAVGAGMIPATLAAVMPMVLGGRKRKRRNTLISQHKSLTKLPSYSLLSSALQRFYNARITQTR